MYQSAEIGELAKALAGVQRVLEPASKNASNPMLRNKYADLASCYEACRHILPEHGLAVSQLVVPSEPNTVCVRTMLLHESGQWLASDCKLEAVGNKGVNAAQAAGSAITYARRYGLSAIVGLVADDDDDGCGAGPTRQQKKETIQEARQHAVANNPDPATAAQLKAIMACLQSRGIRERDDCLAELGRFLGRSIASSKELTRTEASDFLEAHKPESAPVNDNSF
jgi:threonine dehydrogenase-like Zn-dependent dehydrogenase